LTLVILNESPLGLSQPGSGNQHFIKVDWIDLAFKISYPFDLAYSNLSPLGLSQPGSATNIINVDWIDSVFKFPILLTLAI
jgi:hypothetical protein